MTELCISYDPIADVLYIRLRSDEIVDSEEICKDIIVDYNVKGEIVGIEILNFSKSKIDIKELIVKGVETFIVNLQKEE